MSQLYDDAHRSFQDLHETRRLADRLESLARSEFNESDRAFIESAVMFFLATVDGQNRPTVSYKGGAPGFVRILAPAELVFPAYDGNGMFLSLGNIASRAQVGMLFIDFQSPRRLRIQGTGRVMPTEGVPVHFPGAQHLVRVHADQIFVNCGRYIHKLDAGLLSPHIPDETGRQPFPSWKRLDVLTEFLSERDRNFVMTTGGPVEINAYRGEDPAEESNPAPSKP